MIGCGEMGLEVLEDFEGIVSRNAYGVSPEVITASAIALAIFAPPVLVFPISLL